jgi:hypothetical protein
MERNYPMDAPLLDGNRINANDIGRLTWSSTLLLDG